MDGDGDLDLFIANIGIYPEGEQNRLLLNLSTPDSVLPVIPRTTRLPDTEDTRGPYWVTSTVWDNTGVTPGAVGVVCRYSIGGPFGQVVLREVGGFLYRGSIPGQRSGVEVRYYIAATDRQGNVTTDPPGAPDSTYRFRVGPPTGVDQERPESQPLSLSFALRPNRPNPFNPSTVITYTVPSDAGRDIEVRLLVFDVRGEKVATLVSERQEPGFHVVSWDGRSDAGMLAPSGIYFCRLQAGPFVSNRKMTLLR